MLIHDCVYHNQMVYDNYGEHGQDESTNLGLGQNSVSYGPPYDMHWKGRDGSNG